MPQTSTNCAEVSTQTIPKRPCDNVTCHRQAVERVDKLHLCAVCAQRPELVRVRRMAEQPTEREWGEFDTIRERAKR
jgi:hypothetical protein